MDKINKSKKSEKIPKEIRVIFNLNNDKDKILYEKLIEFTQPGRIIKKILHDNIDNDKSSNTQNDINVNSELIKALNKLSDKIDSLKVIKSEDTEIKDEIKHNEVSLTAQVSSDDLDDIDF